ncbi:hypothetical protein JL720_15953 [Aureococcus anophagefferens]|nr:hypothetical protein JL720_15953 [Aureococcus anophagefferens]
MGAHLNAYTSREQTVYYAKLFKEDVGAGMEILGDILQNSLLDAGAVERERDVILREMEEVNKQHEELILDLLHEAAYAGGGLGRTILGPEANIRTISRDDLDAYRARGVRACHSYVTFNTCYKDGGLFGLYLVAPASGCDAAVAATMGHLAALGAATSWTTAPRAKAQLKANVISQLDALAHVCEEIGRQFLTYDRRVPSPSSRVAYRPDAAPPRAFLGGRAHAMAAYGAVDKPALRRHARE